MKWDSNNHSVFLLNYHLVLVVKYRRNVFDDMSDYATDIFVRLSENYNITRVEWNHDVDHVRVLFKAHPNTEMTKCINAYKSASSRFMKRDFPQVKKKLWKEMFWSRSFCLRTTGGSPIDVVKTYIENQSEK
ncbi:MULTISPECIES: IS200/IS605 family transposase [Bacillus]|uniref:IS200/IS605 family transposase n=1 Tax=Bacillus cereus TaxID=1396 RepID=A0A9X6GF36_BACCE|nr:IS200/IS605 family transposase [Bacillus cereus]OOR74144.1 IS200/IS605 family transposase [Bacillus cereus]